MLKGKRGFTLVELMIGIAIASMLIFIVGNFFVINQKIFYSESREVDVQREAEKAILFIAEEVEESYKFKLKEDAGKKEYIFDFKSQLGEIENEGLLEGQGKFWIEDGNINFLKYGESKFVVSRNVTKLDIKDDKAKIVIEVEVTNQDQQMNLDKTVYMRNY